MPMTLTTKWTLLHPLPKTMAKNLNAQAVDLRLPLAPGKTYLTTLPRRRAPVALPLPNQIPRTLYSSLFLLAPLSTSSCSFCAVVDLG